MVSFNIFLKRGLEKRNLGEGLAVHIQKLPCCRDLAAEIFVRKHYCAVDEVAEDGNEFAVVARLEVLPAEIVVLGLRSVGGKHVTQHVLLAREVLEVFVCPYGPSAGG